MAPKETLPGASTKIAWYQNSELGPWSDPLSALVAPAPRALAFQYSTVPSHNDCWFQQKVSRMIPHSGFPVREAQI